MLTAGFRLATSSSDMPVRGSLECVMYSSPPPFQSYQQCTRRRENQPESHQVVMVGLLTSGPTWTDPLDWDLLTTISCEKLELFARHVRLLSDPKWTPSFLSFPCLPLEVQVHILTMCDSATLFSLMHVSTTMRKEASKLFWSDPNVWYTIEGSWLLSGGLAGDTYYVVRALQYMQRIGSHRIRPYAS